MKQRSFISIFTVLFILFSLNSSAQSQGEMYFKRIIRLIENDSITKLAKLIKFPIIRENPLPDISSDSFMKYYPILFDSAFKQKLRFFNDSDIFDRGGEYGLVGDGALTNGDRFDGDIWLNEKGNIIRINYSSPKEQELSKQITQKIQSEIYPSVKDWASNIEVLQSSNYLIRIDRTANGIRYVSWGKGKKISDKPDLVLYNGIEEPQGTGGGWIWTFKNGEWEYIIEDNQMCENEKDCGFFLVLKNSGEEKHRTKCEEIK